jgi:CheY-like chemotaxis protein
LRILIVEDDQNKRRQLRTAVESAINEPNVREAYSYRGGLSELIEWTPDVVLLDMTLPTYDVSATDSGGRTRIFGGRDVLQEMQRRGINSSVVLVTQFESFGEGTKRKTLNELTQELQQSFPDIFRNAVYYHPAQANWKTEIEKILKEIHDS